MTHVSFARHSYACVCCPNGGLIGIGENGRLAVRTSNHCEPLRLNYEHVGVITGGRVRMHASRTSSLCCPGSTLPYLIASLRLWFSRTVHVWFSFSHYGCRSLSLPLFLVLGWSCTWASRVGLRWIKGEQVSVQAFCFYMCLLTRFP